MTPETEAAAMSWRALSLSLVKGAPLVLPIGALEQHGPHLPLATDTTIVERLGAAAAAELGGIVLPALPYGAPSRPRSGGGDRFPVPALDPEALLTAVRSLARGSVELGAKVLVVVSWHWENSFMLWDSLRPVFLNSPARAILFDSPADLLDETIRAELFPDGFPGWAADHAGRLETALIAYLEPNPPPHYRRTTFAAPRYDVLPTSPSSVPEDGVFFDPGEVDPSLGRRCFDSITTNLVNAVRAEMGGAR